MATILIVDDLAVNRDLLVAVLGSHGYRLLEASDGEQALDLVRAEHPDLVIADILMPTMDGYEFVRRLRAEPAIADTKTIFCSAHYQEGEAKRLAQACGVLHVVIKPYEPQALLDVVAQVLDAPSAHLARRRTDKFDRDHLRLMTDKLAQKATELQLSDHRLATLIEINLRLASAREPRPLLEGFCRAARDLVAARYAVVCVRSHAPVAEQYCITSGINSETSVRLQCPRSERGALAVVVTKHHPVRLAGDEAGAGATGLPEHHPPVNSFLAAPIASPSQVYGWIALSDKLGGGAFTAEDERLTEILAAQVGRIYENGGLYAAVQQHVARLELEIAERRRAEDQIRGYAKRLLETQELERRDLARELHDRVGGNLSAVVLNLNIIRAAPAAKPFDARLGDCETLTRDTIRQVRDVMADLRPAGLDEYGLLEALDYHARQVALRAGLHIEVRGAEPVPRLSLTEEIALFRIAQEALNNVTKHAQARNVTIELVSGPERVTLTITDDGIGFQPGARRADTTGLGMTAMRERTQAIGARLTLSPAASAGATVRVELAKSVAIERNPQCEALL